MNMPPYGQQPSYQQNAPYGPPPGAYAPPPRASSQWGPSSMGMEPNVTAGLAYLIGIFSIIFLIMEKENRFARFHCIQSLLLRAVASIALIVWLVVFFVALVGMSNATAAAPDSDATANAVLSGLGLLFLCYGVILLVDLATAIWGTIAGFTGRMVKFPIIGDLAERWAGGPVVPMPTYAPPPPRYETP